jgi:hypothetical protein
MSTAVWHELGLVAGSCTVCGAEGALSMGEARFERNLVERLRKEYCAPPARFVTCSDCGWRWSVRADDSGAWGARSRSTAPRAERVRWDDDQRAASRTVLPAAEGRRPSRDWAYYRL